MIDAAFFLRLESIPLGNYHAIRDLKTSLKPEEYQLFDKIMARGLAEGIVLGYGEALKLFGSKPG